MKNLLQGAAVFLLLSTVNFQTSNALAQGTAFTYQGRLNNGTNVASGSYDLTFTLYSAVSGGGTVGTSNVVNDLPISNGLFTVSLDFGATPFIGNDRWLEIGVRPGASTGAYTNLVPRQPITATPYATYARGVNAGGLVGQVTGSQLSLGTITGDRLANGAVTATQLAVGSVTSNQLASGAVTTGALANGAVTSAKVDMVEDYTLATTFTSPTPTTQGSFGFSVAAMGRSRVLIGAFGDNGNIGAAYLYSADGMLITTFNNPTPAINDGFGNYVAALGSDRVLVAANGDNGFVGSVYLFGTDGTLLTTFTNPSLNSFRFGTSVTAVGSDRILVGAKLNNTGAANAGAAHLFNTNGTLLTTFTNPAPANQALFGNAVAAVGNDRVLIGAYNSNTGATDAGAAYLFSINGTLLVTFTNPAPTVNKYFGFSVAALGSDRLLIGAEGDSGNAGAAYLFRTNGTLLTTFTNPIPAVGEEFGSSVAALGNDRVLIGAAGASGLSGAAYLFRTNGTLITTYTNPTPAAIDFFGSSVAALGSDRVLIGAERDDTGATDAGSAYLFRASPAFAHGLVAERVDTLGDGAVSTATLDDGAVTAAKISGVLNPSQIPGLDASNIISGTLDKFRLAGSYVQALSLHNPGNSFGGDGSSLTALNAANVTSGVLDVARIPNLDAGKVTSGTFSDARLSGNVALRAGGNNFSGQQTVTGGNVGIGTTTPMIFGAAAYPAGWDGIHVRSANNGLEIIHGASSARLHLRADSNAGNISQDFVIANGADKVDFMWLNAGLANRLTALSIATNGNLTVAGTVTANGVLLTSDRNVKENFKPVSPAQVLQKVAALPITEWNYKNGAADVRHVGPMAQDFQYAFGLNGGDDKHISVVDESGVALAAIQGLNQKLEEQKAENAELKQQLNELKAIVTQLAQPK